MTIREKENELFLRWMKERNDYQPFNKDGVINPEIWSQTTPKILFVLKETNELNGDLRSFLSNGGSKTYYHTWDNIVRWAEVIFFGKYSRHISDEHRTKILAHLCTINLKKKAGKARAKKKEIRIAAENDREFIKEQISFYNLDLVVTCGFNLVSDAFKDIVYQDSIEWKYDINDLWYYQSNNFNKNKPIYVISMPHPNRASIEKWCNQLNELYYKLNSPSIL